MKKRILSLLLVFCLIFTIVPMSAFATDNVTLESGNENNQEVTPTCTCDPIVEGDGVHTNTECPLYQAPQLTDYEKSVALYVALPSADSITDETSDEEKASIKNQLNEAITSYDNLGDEDKAKFGEEHNDLLVKATELGDAMNSNEASTPNNAPTINMLTDISQPAAYGDFTVTVDEGDTAPTFENGVLTFDAEGEYTVAMADGKTSTTNVIVVTADNVTLNLDGITISAPQGNYISVDGARALTVSNDTILNITADSSLTGGQGAVGGTVAGNGGAGISGNVTVKGTAKLTVTGGTGGTDIVGGKGEGGVGIQGNLSANGGSKVSLNGGLEGFMMMHPGLVASKAITGTLSVTDSVVKGGYSDEMDVIDESNANTGYCYVTIEPIPIPSAAKYAADAESPTDYVIDDTANPKTLTIKTAKGAAFWSASGNSYLDYSVFLDNDIDVSHFLWEPVGNGFNRFKGSFDGQEHIISGLTIDGTYAKTGLFGYIDNATIKNVSIDFGSISVKTDGGECSVGGIAGSAWDGKIINCHNRVSIFHEDKGGTSQIRAGGIIGDSNSTQIINCENTGNITVTNATVGAYAGGICGTADSEIIINCYSLGQIKAINNNNGEAYAGGIIGMFSNSGSVTNCYSVGTVTAIQNDTPSISSYGGIVGYSSSNITLTNCFYLASAADKGVGGVDNYVRVTAIGCGTFASNGGELTAGTSSNFSTKQTLSKGNNLLTALNGWVNATANTDYLTWIADSTDSPANSGYPMFGTAWVVPAPVVGTISKVDLYAGENFEPTLPEITDNGAAIDGTIHSEFNTTGTCWQRKWTSDDNWSVIPPKYSVGINLKESVYRLRVAYTDQSSSDIKYVYSNEAPFNVALRQPTLTLTAAPASPQNVGTEITLTATMTDGDLTAGAGLHNIYKVIFKNNGTEIGQAALNTDTGVATYTYTPTGVGNLSFTAERGCDWNFNLSAVSNTLPYTVNGAEGTVSGTIKYDTNAPVNGATVTLVPSSPLLTATTGADGNYYIENVPNGNYNIVVKKGDVTVTDSITMANGIVIKDMKLLGGEKNTVVENKEGTPPVSAGGMNELLSDSKIGTTLIPAETAAVDAGGSVEVKLVAEKKAGTDVAEDKGKIETLAADKELAMFIDLSVLKTVKDSGGTPVTTDEKITTLADIITVAVPIPLELQGKTGISVYRVHNGEAQAIQNGLANAVDGEYFTISADGTYINLHVKNFSTYALGYNAYDVSISGGGTGNSGAGKYAQNAAVTINAGIKSGYSFSGWTVNSGSVTLANASSAATSFTMPANAVSLTANWTVNVGGSGGGGSSSYNDYTISASASEGGSITPSGSISVGEGLNQAFTFKPASGYEISDVLVDGKSVGIKDSYTFENVQKSHTINVDFKKPEQTNQTNQANQANQANPTNQAAGINFEDVTENDWFYDSVKKAVDNGWFAGTSDKAFSPYIGTTRGMIATVLWRMEKEPTSKLTASFDDVLKGQWFFNGITWAQENEIVKGYGNGKYGPNDNITREQLASILYRYAKFKGYDITKRTNLGSFSDGNKVSAYASESMKWAVAYNLISGKGNRTLDPAGKATRAEVAAILTRFDETFSNK